MSKYNNEAIIGNKNMLISFSKKGELLRLFYPTRDFKQFIEEMYFGVKINDSRIIYLHEDINNTYNQYYTKSTNILNTEIENTYFNLKIKQTDFVPIDKDILIKRYILINNNTIDLNINFLMYSNLYSNINNMVGAKIKENSLIQYTHDYCIKTTSNCNISGHKLNGAKNEIEEGKISDKDYIGMAKDAGISYEVGTLKPGESKEIDILITINKNDDIRNIEKIDSKSETNVEVEKEEKNTEKYWKKYVEEHDGLQLLNKENNQNEQIKNIYERSILLFPLLTNETTGGIVAAVEVDEERTRSGRYSYCWPRDAIFITKALDILKMNNISDKFYESFCASTQEKNGMWEQRFYTDGRLAPCWGYQIDETASIVYGVYEHYLETKNEKILKQNYEMCKKAIEYLKGYIDYITKEENENNHDYNNYEYKNIYERNESYDLWEMNEGIHLYSISAIYGAFEAFKEMTNITKNIAGKRNTENKEKSISKVEEIEKIESYIEKIKKYSEEKFIDKDTKILRRNNKDNKMDISMLGSIIPFKMFNKEQINNTIEKINMTLRTYTGGYIRFEEDNYLTGNNPWVIATLWMALYNIEINNKEEAKKEIDFVLKTANKHGFLPEQIDNKTMQEKWVIGLGWSHAMFIIALSQLGGN